MLDWFDWREYRLYKWLRINTLDRFYVQNENTSLTTAGNEMWQERNDAENAVRVYLSDLPSKRISFRKKLFSDGKLDTVTFLHGPAGSGKTEMLQSILKGSPRCL